MNTFVGKFRTNADVQNGIAIVKKNDTENIVRTYEKKDEILRTYEESIAYSWYIIPVEDDELIYVNNQKWRRFGKIYNGLKDTIYNNVVAELYDKAEESNVELPAAYTDALKTSLRELFKFPVFPDSERRWNTLTVFQRYVKILRAYEKKVNDFVENEIIDNFFEQLIAVYAISEIKVLLSSDLIEISKEVLTKWNKLQKDFDELRKIAFSVAEKSKDIHNWYYEWETKYEFEGMELRIKVKRYHVYVLIPYGKKFISECVGWLDF